MGKKLAIQGHDTRGDEVIELLEMMGGTNPFSDGMVIGNKATNCYYISEDTVTKYISWDYIGPDEINEYEIFTLEEFLEKYPFKIDDKVFDKADGCPGVVSEMKWDEDVSDMKYFVVFGNGIDFGWYVNDSIEFYKETDTVKPVTNKSERTREDVIFDSIIWHLRNSVNNGKQNLSGGECEDYFRKVVKKNNENKMKNVLAELLEHIKTTPKEELEKEFKEIEEWSNIGPTVEEFMTFCESVNKKPKYPTTYDDCCDMLNADEFVEYELMTNFPKLINARNAYWKIAGEEMGLDKPWKPDWNDISDKHCIYFVSGDIWLKECQTRQCTLAFPTAEIRDIFYENFKELIESCKELL